MRGKTLIIWFKAGNTGIFKEVENFEDGVRELEFDYFGQSTLVKRHAFFSKINISGYAIQKE